MWERKSDDCLMGLLYIYGSDRKLFDDMKWVWLWRAGGYGGWTGRKPCMRRGGSSVEADTENCFKNVGDL